VLDHPVGCCLAQPLSILIDDGLFVVVGFCVVDKTFAVALDLGKGRVFAGGEFVLSVEISMALLTCVVTVRWPGVESVPAFVQRLSMVTFQ
jgi:hypothetical protein